MSHSHRLVSRLFLPWVAMMSALPALAAEPQRCSTIVEDAARLACYDAVFGAPAPMQQHAAPAGAPAASTTAAAAPTTVPVAAAAVTGTAAATAAPLPTPEDQFGLAPAQVKKKAEPPARPQEPESIESVLQELTKRRTGELIYTLENGQRWIQVEADTDGKLAPGAVVTIRKASMGSYKLVSGSVSTRVRRIQ